MQLLANQISADMQQRPQPQRGSPAVAASEGGPGDEPRPLEPRVVGVCAEGQLLGYICIRTVRTLMQCWPGKLLVGMQRFVLW
jgi:hypothetical protein